MAKKFNIKRMDDMSDLFGSNTKAWLGQNVIIYTSIGSSSCPPIVERVEENEDGIHLFTKDYSNSICTSDFMPVVQFIEYSDFSSIERGTKIFLDGVLQR